MTKYKAGALSAFLSGQPVDDEEETPELTESVIGKKSKKKSRRKSPSSEDVSAPVQNIDSKDESEPTEQPPQDAATSSKKRQSYGKLMSEEEKKRTVFVGNLPTDITRKTLKRLFASCGTVETVRLRSAIPRKPHLPKKAAVIKRELSEKQGTLVAYVKFKASESAQEALNLNGTLLDGHHIQVDSCTSGKRYDDKRTVFLGNLPFDANEEALYEHFSDCGDIEKVRLVRDRSTGEGKGFGFVVFKDPTSVSFALKLNGEKLRNRELRITRVVKKHKKLASKNMALPARSGKKWQKERFTPGKKAFQKKNAGGTVPDRQNKQPSKRIRQLVKKRKAKKEKKSYTATV